MVKVYSNALQLNKYSFVLPLRCVWKYNTGIVFVTVGASETFLHSYWWDSRMVVRGNNTNFAVVMK